MNIIKHSLAVLGLIAAPAFAASQVSISIDAGKPGPVINKNVYGQFAEHLGTGVYDGMWVGTKSNIPNTRGWRNDVVGALKETSGVSYSTVQTIKTIPSGMITFSE